MPVIGIGGITASNAGAIIRAGAVGVAVIGAVLGAADPEAAAREISAAVSPA
jgi:thiamine-phosphate pyrophosphorylase